MKRLPLTIYEERDYLNDKIDKLTKKNKELNIKLDKIDELSKSYISKINTLLEY